MTIRISCKSLNITAPCTFCFAAYARESPNCWIAAFDTWIGWDEESAESYIRTIINDSKYGYTLDYLLIAVREFHPQFLELTQKLLLIK